MTTDRPTWLTDHMAVRVTLALRDVEKLEADQDHEQRQYLQLDWELTDEQTTAAWTNSPDLHVPGATTEELAELRRDTANAHAYVLGRADQLADHLRRQLQTHLGLTEDQAGILWRWAVQARGRPSPAATAGPAAGAGSQIAQLASKAYPGPVTTRLPDSAAGAPPAPAPGPAAAPGHRPERGRGR